VLLNSYLDGFEDFLNGRRPFMKPTLQKSGQNIDTYFEKQRAFVSEPRK
jgi:hypothetical protein